MSSCALCSTAAPPPFRAPAPETSPDLDLRPGEPARSTLPRWVAQCRHCGACGPDLSQLPPTAAPITATATYRGTKSRFLRWAVLVAGTPQEADALLQAAWEADDRGQDAVTFRRMAAAVWPEPESPEETLQLVDILRRAGSFEKAAEWLGPLAKAPDDTTRLIAAFQQARIDARDTGRHQMSSALRPPSRTPHVAHGRSNSGFWGRLFGGAGH